MQFKVEKGKEIIIEASDVDLNDRWIIHHSDYYKKSVYNKNIKLFLHSLDFDKNILNKKQDNQFKRLDSKLRRTSLALCEDTVLEREVLVKSVVYNKDELNNAEAIKLKRGILEAQIDILNSVASNMLPEPLDFFTVKNNSDFFTGDAEDLVNSEPILILDYLPGDILADKLMDDTDKSFYKIQADDNQQEGAVSKDVNVSTVMRLIGDILLFEQELYEKGYAYTALSPDHIVLLGDLKPRFIGLGRICPVVFGDRFDSNHINFGRQLKGYSAPEFNKKEKMFGANASVKASIAFNIGVLIVNILLKRNFFEEKHLKQGAYVYTDSDKGKIQKMYNGTLIDDLICNLTNEDPSKRLTDFESIFLQLDIISGNAYNESRRQEILYGTVAKFIYREQNSFGFVTSNGVDYYFNEQNKKYLPSGYHQVGTEVIFIPSNNRHDDKKSVYKFLKPGYYLNWPSINSTPESRGSGSGPNIFIPNNTIYNNRNTTRRYNPYRSKKNAGCFSVLLFILFFVFIIINIF